MLVDAANEADGAYITIEKVVERAQWEAAGSLFDEVYGLEKSWAIPAAPGVVSDGSPGSMLLLKRGDEPAGLLHVLRGSGLCPTPAIEADFRAWLNRKHVVTAQVRVAQWKRLLTHKRVRSSPRHLMALLLAALRESVATGCTHILADTFEDQPQPRRFLTDVLGFESIGTRRCSEPFRADLNFITVAADIEQVLVKARQVPRFGKMLRQQETGCVGFLPPGDGRSRTVGGSRA